mmetsp:Transcript_59367/g.173648  ORF Transcript_59367/g.173648 Transcript_59367/m.173648 type:complete len:711 (-) Transcript_59367:66-2198(-)
MVALPNPGKAASGADTLDAGVWVVADPRSAQFGQVFADSEALAAGIRRGLSCLVTTGQGVLLLERVQSPEKFLESYQAQACTSGSVLNLRRQHSQTEEEGMERTACPRQWQRLSQLGQIDLFSLRPTVVKHRTICGFAIVVVYMYLVMIRYYYDSPPLVAPLLAFTIWYPLMLCFIARYMHQRERPVQQYVFELLLALDLYQLTTSLFIFVVALHEAYMLGLLRQPWGNPVTRTSPFLRKLVWLHYHNRIIELFDTVIRISQRKFRAYGALHVYLRLVFLWGWLAVCRVGGGDFYFHTVVDAGVTSVRFFVFTLTILEWNWNLHVDFGLHAPKIALFRKEHLYHLQILEFALLAMHALYCGYWNTMSRWLALFQVVVMFNGMSIFMDFYYSRDSLPARKPDDSRLTFSFDSSCWLFIYHFGVAKWVQDHVNVTVKDFAFSGSSGGALVAATLACQLPADEVKNLALQDFHLCQRNPLHMFRIGEQVLDHYLRDTNLFTRCSGHLRVLLTKVSSTPPLLGAEVASQFRSWRDLFSCLRASMHVPMAAGILPYPIPGRGWFYDGLVWAALFVPWRAFDDDDVIVRVSAVSFPNAQIGPRWPLPFWWLIMPPSAAALHGLFWMGYRDAHRYFMEDTSSPVGCCDRRNQKRSVPGQIEALRKHLRQDPKNSFDEHAARLLADVQASAAMHWKIGFIAMAVASTLSLLAAIVMVH